MRSAFGTITKRGHNCYRLQWNDRAGRRRSKTVHGTRAAAQKELSRIECGLTAQGGTMTYGAYWDEYVTPTFSNLKPKTVSEYYRLWNRELEPRIGMRRIEETTWRDVQAVIDEIQAPAVQRKAFVLWRKVCNLAIRDDLIRANPCQGVTFKSLTKRTKALIAAADIPEYMEAIRNIKYESLLLVLLGGGLRVSEACALEWCDVREWQGAVIVSVSKALVTVEGQPVLQTTTKTAKSRREVVIGEPFAARLIELSTERKGGSKVSEGAPTTIAHNYKAWCTRHGVTHVRLGDFRSLYATLCGEAGCPDSLVSMQLGHTDGTTKGTYYQQVTLSGKKLVADTLAAFIKSSHQVRTKAGISDARDKKTGQSF